MFSLFKQVSPFTSDKFLPSSMNQPTTVMFLHFEPFFPAYFELILNEFFFCFVMFDSSWIFCLDFIYNVSVVLLVLEF